MLANRFYWVEYEGVVDSGHWREDRNAPDVEQSTLNVIAAAEALEARQMLETCRPLARFTGTWAEGVRSTDASLEGFFAYSEVYLVS